MSELSTAHSLWFRHIDQMPARERLRKVMAEFTRARRLQVLMDHGFGGLLAGFSLATIAVLVARLAPSPYAPWQVAGAAVIVALAVALLVGWWRRPDALEVAIRADLRLKLKQRLSTAWEFMAVHGDGELTERLAVQAVKAGLPARSREVFPLRINRWGRLAPLAATALLLASVIDLARIQTPMPHAVDEQVMNEGARLGAFGRAMQERARREELPRSARQAGELGRLGARMESGALSRSGALGELRRMGESLDRDLMQVLEEANRSDGDSRRAQTGKGPPNASGPNPDAMLDRTPSGALESAEDRERSGIPRRELESAPGRRRAGADDALRDTLEKLARIDRARKEDRELRGAREQVRRARENLGESPAGTDRGRGPGPDIDWGEDEGEERGVKGAAKPGADRRDGGEAVDEAGRSGSQRGSSVATDRQHSPLLQDSAQSGPLLKPRGQMREGEVFSSQGRILPRSGRPSVESVEMSREFAPQVEEVLAREEYPAHYKEFIRRYFLSLSQGARTQPPPAARGAP